MEHAVQKSKAHAPAATELGVCGECGAPHHDDQRYCLSCGGPLADPGAATVPFAPVSGATASASASGLSERLLASSPPSGSSTTSSHQLAGTSPSSPPPHLLAGSPSHSPAHGDGSAPTVIAGVGVLLLAMGVGVLIGRTGNSAPASTAAPQVVTVSAPTTGTSSSESAPSESASGSSRKGGSGKHHGKGRGSSNGVGSSIEKPAPPSVVTNLHRSGGGSYEQKSKELPNVISTG